ncbi:MAG: hypothetical protein QM723_33550 [Myxococcaceae bacterium]
MRLAPALVLLLACGGKLASTAGDVSAPGGVTFPQGWVGYPVTAPLVLTNGSSSPRSLHLELPDRFTVDSNDLTLQGGEARTVALTFSPAEPGAYELEAHVSGELTATVHLSARANLPPKCESTNSCVTLTFDPKSGTCAGTAAPDGSTCNDPCIEDGVCLKGVCMGGAKSCDDGNACTADACGADGCVHQDLSLSCPHPSDPCQAAYCDPMKGCLSNTVPDGTSCGPNDCATAHICIAGTCQQRPAPDGSLCATASLCQGAGYCHGGSCDQPAATTLTPKWTYRSPVTSSSVGDVAADAQGNLYLTQYLESCNVCEVEAPGPICQVVSLDPGGNVRWIQQRADSCTRWAVDDVFGQLYVLENNNVIDALDLADGSVRWSVDVTTMQLSGVVTKPSAYARYVKMVALGDSRAPLFVNVTQDDDWLVGIDRATGTRLFDQHYFASLSQLATDDFGVVFLSTPADGSPPHLLRLSDTGSVVLDQQLQDVTASTGFLQFGRALLFSSQGTQLFNATTGVASTNFGSYFWGATNGDRYTLWVNGGAPFALPDVEFPMLNAYDAATGAVTATYDFSTNDLIWETLVTDHGSAVAIASDDSGLHASSYLFEADARGDVLAKCPVVDEAWSGSLLTGGTLYLRTSLGVAAYDLPGYRLGTGWSMPGANPARSYHAP